MVFNPNVTEKVTLGLKLKMRRRGFEEDMTLSRRNSRRERPKMRASLVCSGKNNKSWQSAEKEEV